MSKKSPILATALMNLYRAEFLAREGQEDEINSYTCQSLLKKIKEKYPKELIVKMYNSRQGNFIYPADMSEMDARASIEDGQENTRMQNMIYTVALHLRSVIFKMKKWKTPEPTTVNTLKDASPAIPDELQSFFQTLLCGLKMPVNDEIKQRVSRKVQAMSADAVYNVSRGSVRPWKHTVLALGLGTLTGSKIILEMMNRLGYTLNYSEVKALETEFAFSIAENEQDAPDGVCLKPTLGTGLAWDNYDVNMETLDGGDTLHATVGICYQNVTDNTETSIERYRDERNRRKFEGGSRIIPPFFKSLKSAKYSEFGLVDHGIEDGREDESEDEKMKMFDIRVSMKMHDFFWFLQTNHKSVPLFAGYTSQYVTDALPQHKIFYMDPISAAPTRNDVVRETMIRSMNVARETGQEYIVVTYDLAVALKAYAIQAIESPLFDKLSILIGNFHLEMALYGGYGTFIKESGVEYLLTESGVLASGSVMGFLRGKFYNRCARIHELLALAMEQNMYQKFLTTIPPEESEAIKDILVELPDEIDEEQLKNYHSKDELKHHMQKYQEFFDHALDRKLGPTAKQWAMYIVMITVVHRNLMRSVRTNDVPGYVSVLPQVITIFNALNRPNYARWAMLFLMKLLKALPGLKAILDNGAFSIRRTSKNFSRSAVDIALEQTVNRDAASPMHGIVGFQNSESSIRRWCITATQRGEAVTQLRQLVGLDKQEQPASQLKASRIKKDNADVATIRTAITEFCDPFTVGDTAPDQLLNLASGRAANKNTEKYLLESFSEGKKRSVQFLKECEENPARFMEPIKKRKVENFASENAKSTKTASKGKSVDGVRDLFGRMLVVAAENSNLDLGHVMEYPITTYPLSLTHPDGGMMKTPKSKLLGKLEKFQDGAAHPPNIAATVIDGGLLLHSVLSVTGPIASYGSLARNLLANICRYAGKEIHILFDAYYQSSIKGSERQLRGATTSPFVITGAEQRPKHSGIQLLKNDNFKEQLAIFLLKEWRKPHYGPVLNEKVLLASHGGKCYRYACATNNMETTTAVTVEQPVELQGKHEEADTLIALHVSNLAGNVVVRASDTDVLVILLAIKNDDDMERHVFMDCGSGNCRRLIDVAKIQSSLEEKQPGFCSALPGLHALSGCDFTASFYGKGKLKPFEILENDDGGNFIEFFRKLTDKAVTPDPAIAELYVCRLYGFKNLTSVNEARYSKLLQMTGKIDKNEPLHNAKKIDCSLLPPCSRTLMKKVERAHYVAIMWGNAFRPDPTDGLNPEDYGWKCQDGIYQPVWYNGASIPDKIFPEAAADVQEEADIEEYANIDDQPSSDEEGWSSDTDTESGI